MKEKKTNPIAVFDSGMGGISVLKSLVALMPNENYLYLGDSKNAPYGTKSLEEARKLTFDNVDYLLDKGAKAVVVACNTATSAAVALLRKKYPDLALIGLEPALKPAVQRDHARVVVMATPLTLREKKFHNLMKRFQKEDSEIYLLPAPDLVELVEQGKVNAPETERYLREILAPYIDKEITGVVLGCTHFPFAKRMIQQIVGLQAVMYDGGEGAARETKRRLKAKGLLNDQTEPGQVIFENSLNMEEEIKLSKALFAAEM